MDETKEKTTGETKHLPMPCKTIPVKSALNNLIRWLGWLDKQYGYQLLALLLSSHAVLKGFVNSMAADSTFWIYKSYEVSGPTLQIYQGIVGLPWAIKPVIGMFSDLFPINGYNKRPYIMIVSLFAIASICAIGFMNSSSMSIGIFVLCLSFISLQISVCDLLVEARYSEELNKDPEHAPDLMTFVSSTTTCGSIVAIVGLGWLIPMMGPRFSFQVVLPFAALILYPAARNYLKERPKSDEESMKTQARLLEQMECFVLCVLMLLASVCLCIIGMSTKSALERLTGVLATLIVVLVSFSIFLTPKLAKVNAFFLLQTALDFSISGATSYFYINGPAQYSDGPHFSIQFFTTGLGLITSSCSLLGFALYNRYMKDWTYRKLLLIGNLSHAVLALVDMLMFTRFNRQLGIPDHFFVLGASISARVIGQWKLLPGTLMLSQMCPKGMEATTYALLSGCHNLGNTLAEYLGAYVLERLQITPAGRNNEGAAFQNLWIASLLSFFVAILTPCLIPLLIPDGRQTDKLLEESQKSTTEGSLWQQWTNKRKVPWMTP